MNEPTHYFLKAKAMPDVENTMMLPWYQATRGQVEMALLVNKQ